MCSGFWPPIFQSVDCWGFVNSTTIAGLLKTVRIHLQSMFCQIIIRTEYNFISFADFDWILVLSIWCDCFPFLSIQLNTTITTIYGIRFAMNLSIYKNLNVNCTIMTIGCRFSVWSLTLSGNHLTWWWTYRCGADITETCQYNVFGPDFWYLQILKI